jgi:hypothetical protein
MLIVTEHGQVFTYINLEMISVKQITECLPFAIDATGGGRMAKEVEINAKAAMFDRHGAPPKRDFQYRKRGTTTTITTIRIAAPIATHPLASKSKQGPLNFR